MAGPPTGNVRWLRNGWKWAIVLVAAIALSAAGTRALLRHLSTPALLAELPPVPDLSDASPAMTRQIGEADAAARERVHSADRVGHLGMVYHANLFYQRAAPCYRLAVRLARRDRRWPYYLALLCETTGQTHRALPWFERAARLAPDAPWVSYRLANAELKLSRLDRARQGYLEVANTDTHRQHGLLGMAEVARREEEWQRVIDLLSPALREDPDFGPARHLLAAAYEALDRPDQAREVLPLYASIPTSLPTHDPLSEAIDQLSCSSSHLLKQAITAERTEDRARAGQLLERLVEVAPDDTDGHLAFAGWLRETAVSLRENGRPAEADPYLRRGLEEALLAVDLEPDSATAHNSVGMLLNDLGEAEAAIEHLTRAVELDPNLHIAHGNLAAVLVMVGRYEEAIDHSRTALDVYPDQPDYLNCLGAALKHSGDREGAVRTWYEAIEADAEYSPARYNLAQEFISRGNYRFAAEHLSAILEYYPDHLEALELMAWLQSQPDAGGEDGEAHHEDTKTQSTAQGG